MESQRRPRLTPVVADVRRAVREMLPSTLAPTSAPDEFDGDFVPNRAQEAAKTGLGGKISVEFVLVGLSGGADSLALAAATAFESNRAGVRAGAIIIDHGLQAGSADVARVAADQARDLGLDPVLVRAVTIEHGSSGEGPEAAARTARYAAFEQALAETGADAILLGHTLDDQAETVLLGLARGSGPTSLQGMAARNGPYLRPLLGLRRTLTQQFCVDAGLVPWQDPHNVDPAYARVRVRGTVLPVLESELGPGIAEALARTAEQLREDAAALDEIVREIAPEVCEPAEAGIAVSVVALEANPPALRHRVIRFVVDSEFGVSLERVHVLAVARLVTDWHGQGALDLPGVRVVRQGGLLVFSAPGHAPIKGPSRSHGTSRH